MQITVSLLARNSFEGIESISDSPSPSFQTLKNVVLFLPKLSVGSIPRFGWVHHQSNRNLTYHLVTG